MTIGDAETSREATQQLGGDISSLAYSCADTRGVVMPQQKQPMKDQQRIRYGQRAERRLAAVLVAGVAAGRGGDGW